MSGLRILKVTISPLLGELMVAVLAPHLLLDVVGIVETRDALATAVGAWAPDLLLLGLRDDEDCSAARAMLAMRPGMRVLAVAATGGRAWLLECQTPTLSLPGLSMAALIAALTARFALQHLKG